MFRTREYFLHCHLHHQLIENVPPALWHQLPSRRNLVPDIGRCSSPARNHKGGAASSYFERSDLILTLGMG